MRSLVLPLLLSVIGVASVAGETAPPRPRAETVAEHFVESWNAHAPAKFSEVLDADTDWITASGLVLRGKTDIQNYLGSEHATWARETHMAATGIHSRPISADAMVVRLQWKITGPTSQSFTGVTQFVVTRTAHGWRVVSGQVTSDRGRART